MQPTNVVLLQSDPGVAKNLAASLSNSFRGVHVAQSVDEVRRTLVTLRPYTIILDLESASLADVELLKQEFQGTRIICTHRVADEEMWTKNPNRGG